MPALSVVIPTRLRPETLVRTLTALARQEVVPNTFEVIVVADGEEKESLADAQRLEVPFPLSLLSQPRGGAAAARNRGASDASAPIVLFLDDDMEAGPNLIREHLGHHSDSSADVVLGHFTQATEDLSDPFFASYVRAWWSHRFLRLAEPEHRFSYDDLFSGHFSIKRELISDVGGFDDRFTHRYSGEDYEMGVRLLAAGARFTFAPAATAVHQDDPTVERALRRSFADGRGHAIIARTHPDMLVGLPLAAALGGQGRPRPRRARAPRIPSFSLTVARKLKLRRFWGLVFGRAHQRAYWAGVLAELGSHAAIGRILQEAQLTPCAPPQASFDIRSGHAGLVEILGAGRVDSLDVWVDETPICRIPSAPGAEGLRPVHVADWVSHHFAWDVVTALGRLGWGLGDHEHDPGVLDPQAVEATQ